MEAPRQQRAPGWSHLGAHLALGPDPVLMLGPKGSVQRMSRPIGGLAPGTLQGSRFEDHVQEGKVPAPGSAGVVRIGTAERSFWWRLAAIEDEEGTLLVCSDVDAQERELRHLRSAERLMRDTEGMSHLGIWTWDITEPNAVWTPELYRIYGLDPESHTPTYDDYLTRVHPDDVERVKSATEACFQDHAPYSHDERIRHADGHWRYLHTWARPVLDDAGQLNALHGVCLDITERKHAENALTASEDRLQSIVEHAGLGIATVARDGHLRQTNHVFRELLQRKPGMPLWHDMPLEEAARARGAIEGVLESGEAHTETFAAADSWVRLVLTRVDAEPPFVVAVAQDVSAQHAADEARSRIDELQAQHLEHVEMVGVVGHELKNPLTPVQIQLKLLSDERLGPVTEDQVKAIDRIRSQVDRISGMLHELMDASRAGTGRLNLHLHDVDLAGVVRDAVATHAAAATDFSVELAVTAPDELRATADAGRIAQAIDNLVGNALRFTPDGGRVDVTLAQDGADVVLTVADNGAGIPEELQSRLFEAFSRGKSAPIHPGKSTGLGLYVVKGVAEGHGGHVEVNSTEGRGTTISLRFPVDGPGPGPAS